MNNLSLSDIASIESTDGYSAAELMSTNWQTTAAVGLTVASGGVLGAISLAAFPAQTLGAATAITGLAVAGKRRADGKSPLPWVKDDESSDSKPAAKPAKAKSTKTAKSDDTVVQPAA